MPGLQIFNSIRFRLLLVFSGVILITLVLFGIIVYRTVATSQEREIDADLQRRAEQARVFFLNSGFTTRELEEFARSFGSVIPVSPPATAPVGNAPIMPARDMETGDLASALTYIQIVSRDKQVVQRIPDLKLMAKPEVQAELLRVVKLGTGYENIRLYKGERARVFTTSLDRGVENRGYVQVVRSTEEADTIAASLVYPILGCSLLALLVLITLIWWVTYRAFAPLEEITETAIRITQNRDLSARLPERVRSNNEIGRLSLAFNAMLEKLDKTFQSQKQFIADSSHELRTPLTVIRGNVDLLKRNPDPIDQLESLQAIERESARMQRLVQDLLLLAQADSARQTIEQVPVQLNDLVLDIFKETRVLAQQRHQQLKLGTFDPVTVLGDNDRLKRVILNLVDNAIKYTQEGGEVNIGLMRGNQWARVVVSDNGPGIDVSDQTRIFDRFYRVDKARTRASGGTGLGLAIVQHIVEAHGGRITVESEPGKGTTFTIWLKVASTPDLANLDDESGELAALPVKVSSSSSETDNN